MAKDSEILTTPPGVASFPHFNKARDYKDDGKFAYDGFVVFEGQEAADLAAQCDRWLEESAQKHGKRPADVPYRDHTVKSGEDANGKPIYEPVPGALAFKFKVKSTWPDGSSRKPVFYDARGREIKPVRDPETGELRDGVIIRSGDKIVVNYEPYQWAAAQAGLQLQPLEIQVIEQAQGGKRKGFAAVEGSEPEGDDAGSESGAPASKDDIPF